MMKSREEKWEERLALPVLVATLASIPAMLLSVIESGALGVSGPVLDYASGAVLAAVAVIPLIVAENRRPGFAGTVACWR